VDSFAWIVYIVEQDGAHLAPGLHAFPEDAAFAAGLLHELYGHDLLIDCVPWAAAIDRYEWFTIAARLNPETVEKNFLNVERHFRLLGNLPPGL